MFKKHTAVSPKSHSILHHLPKRWFAIGTILTLALGLAIFSTVGAMAQSTTSHHHNSYPVVVTVFSPGQGDVSGVAGAGYVIDLSLDAANPADNWYLSAANGYKPFFNNPTSPTFHPGPDLGAPGLVVLLSTTRTIPGTAFKGLGTNLAGLFQINGVARVNGGTIAETWNTWQVGKPIAGAGVETTLTVFVVKGTAPAFIQGNLNDLDDIPGLISNVVRVHFTIAG